MIKFAFFSIITALVLCNWTLFIHKWYAPRTGDINEILLSHGYPLETHNVKTEDGYILALHRIPFGRNDHSTKEIHKRPPVLLMHGLACSSVDWIIKSPEEALPFKLADAGYDVWLGNNRGNTYSRHHVTLHPDIDTQQFFNYSYHEIGIYDLPAMIDHVLNRTGYKQLTYIGFSEGFTSFVVMGSLRPEYNEKILLMNGFAPVTVVQNANSLIFNFLARNPKTLEIPHHIGWYEIITHEIMSPVLRVLCTIKPFCRAFFKTIGLSDNQLYNQELLLSVLSNFPAGISLKQITHYIQGTITGIFRRYDYGREKNIEIYGKAEPPPYDLTKVTAPIILYYGEDDIFMNNDALLNSVAKMLPNVIKVFRVPEPHFDHLDFLYGKDMSALTEEALQNIDEYNNINKVKILNITS